VIVRVGYGRGCEVANRLEANNVICNYQALPDDESFTAASGLRMGVAEMTRFGMEPDDLATVADLVRAVVLDDADVAADVRSLRSRFTELGYCFGDDVTGGLLDRLRGLV
jgi:aminomethyltransferase